MDNCHRDTSGLPTRQPPGSAVREAAQEPCSPRSGATPSRAGITSYQAVALERARTQLTRCLDRASRSQWVETSECRWLRSIFAEKTFHILFVGQSRQSTTAVINALLGERVLPSPLYARDATVSVVRYGPNPTARLEPSESRVFDASSEPQRQTALQSAPRARRVIIERPSSWLAGGLELLYTPPVGSLWEYNRHVAHRYLASVDAIVLVSSVWRPLSRLESEFLSDLVPYGEKAFSCSMSRLHPGRAKTGARGRAPSGSASQSTPGSRYSPSRPSARSPASSTAKSAYRLIRLSPPSSTNCAISWIHAGATRGCNPSPGACRESCRMHGRD